MSLLASFAAWGEASTSECLWSRRDVGIGHKWSLDDGICWFGRVFGVPASFWPWEAHCGELSQWTHYFMWLWTTKWLPTNLGCLLAADSVLLCTQAQTYTHTHLYVRRHIFTLPSPSLSLSSSFILGTCDSHHLGSSRPKVLRRYKKPPPLCQHSQRHPFTPGSVSDSCR